MATASSESVSMSPNRYRLMGWISIGVCGALAVYALAGFLVLPWWIRSYGTRMLSDAIQRPVKVADAAFNPFKFTLRLNGISIQDSDGRPLVAVARIFADLEPALYLGGTATVRALEIEQPEVHITRLADGSLNLAKIAPVSAPDTEPEEVKNEPVRFLLTDFTLRDGRVVFRDETVGGFETTVAPLSLKVAILTNRPGEKAVYNLAFQTAVGEKFNLNGSLDLTGAFATEGKLALTAIPLAHYAPYFRDHVGFEQAGGRINIGLTYRYAVGQTLIEDLSFALADLALRNPADQKMFFTLPKLTVSGGRVDTRARAVTVQAVGVEGLSLTARRTAEGRIDVLDLITAPKAVADKPDDASPAPTTTGKDAEPIEAAGKPDEAQAPATTGKDAPGWTVKVAKVAVGTGALRFEDPAVEQAEAELESLTVEVADIATGTAGTTVGQAKLTLQNLALAKQFEAPSAFQPARIDLGTLTVEVADIGIGTADTTVGQAGMTVQNLTLADPKGKAPLVEVPQITVSEGSFDSARRKASIAKIEVTGTRIRALRRANGTVDIADLFVAKAGKTAKATSAASPAPDSAAPAWAFELETLVLDDHGLAFTDQVPEPDANIAVDRLVLTVKNLSTDPAAVPKIELNCRINQIGDLSVGGDVRLDPLTSELALTVKDLPIQPFQPYFGDQVGLIVTDGRVGAKGRLSLALPEGAPARIRYRGGADITRFVAVDKRQSKDFLRWKSLFVEGADIVTEPMAVRVGKVALSDYYARLIVNADGTLNMTEIFGPQGEAKKAMPTPAPKATAAARKSPPLPIKIDEITLQGGQVDFSDFLAKPNFETRMVNLGGRVSGLSSEASQRADVMIQGALENHSPLEISGQINPLAQETYTDLKMTFRNIELSPFSSYSGKYLGYTLAKGKLNLELTYKIAERKLTARNRIFFDALTLGDRVESPEATSLPIKLALALLTDRQGRIELDVPVSGDLDDPQFSIFGIVVKALVNLLTKIITSPFDALASLFDGQVVTHLDFEPGRSALAADAYPQIAKLADALDARPALKLEIEGKSDPQTDEPAIRRERFDALLRATKRKAFAGQGGVSLENIQIDPAEKPEIVALAYAEADFPKPRDEAGKEKILPPEEMEKLLFTGIEVDDNDLHRLAKERAGAVRDRLLADTRISADRVFMVEARVEQASQKEEGRRVQFSLR